MFLLFDLLVPFVGTNLTIWIAICILVYLYRHVTTRQNYWQSKGIKYIKPKFLLGSLSILRSKSFAETVLDIYNEFPEER
jgi:hypothetical protein